jgi:hypothetical protein
MLVFALFAKPAKTESSAAACDMSSVNDNLDGDLETVLRDVSTNVQNRREGRVSGGYSLDKIGSLTLIRREGGSGRAG